MTTLTILSIILGVFVAISIVNFASIEALSKKQKTFVVIVYAAYLAFVVLFAVAMNNLGRHDAEKELLDRPNSYKKEYTYKQIDGEFVAIDSTYIKK